jgi:UPF0755 protein
MTRLQKLLVIGLFLAISAISVAWYQYRTFLNQPMNIPQAGYVVQVNKGASLHSVIADLDADGITSLDWRWRVLTRLQPVSIRAGEYRLSPGLKAAEMLLLLSTGNVITYNFTIIEGWTFKQLKQALAEDPVLKQLAFEQDGDANILQAINSEAMHPEGWFLPETYQYVRGDSDLDILSRAHTAMNEALDNAWKTRAEGLPLKTPYELLILASIVEKESALEAERADIAGVFRRRLEQGWRLETDPTVIYGLGDAYDGDLKRIDLDTDTPYNTRTRFGLPPTPIAMPGNSSLIAAASPAEGTAMFFVASGTGGHVFSDTLDQHNAAVRKMLRNQP